MTVEDLSQRMSERELMEWVAFYGAEAAVLDGERKKSERDAKAAAGKARLRSRHRKR